VYKGTVNFMLRDRDRQAVDVGLNHAWLRLDVLHHQADRRRSPIQAVGQESSLLGFQLQTQA
jgi:hypothetical protein